MHATTFFASLISLAATLPSTVTTGTHLIHQLQQREIVYNHTFDSWPTTQLLQVVSCSYFQITPLNSTHANFRFGNLNGPSSGPPAWDYTVAGDGIDIRTGPIYGAGVKTYDFEITGKPFTVVSDFTPQEGQVLHRTAANDPLDTNEHCPRGAAERGISIRSIT